MNDIVFTLELDDVEANSKVNDYLQDGWTLLHVGTKSDEDEERRLHFSVVYVVGANKELYEQYESDTKKSMNDVIEGLEALT